MTHSWCRDVQRDEAVRAAEDGQSGPLPTLEEAIAMIPKTVSASSETEPENKGNDMSGSTLFPASEQPAPAPPFADGPQCSPAVSETGETQSGARTERVTLEITYDCRFWNEPSSWAWNAILKQRTNAVRVVEEPDFLDIAQVMMQRDAAIRERDGLRWECERRLTMCEEMRRDRDSQQFLVSCLRARVAELEQARERFDTALEEARTRSGINDLILQRDEALEELETAIRERKELKARVAELESAPPASVAAGTATWFAAVGKFGMESVCVAFNSFKECEKFADGEVRVIPLYAAPPPARGWLTDEERDLIAGITDDDDYTEEGQNIAKAILARSSPPEVVIPPGQIGPKDSWVCGWNAYREEALKALAAAGVTVKEVGK